MEKPLSLTLLYTANIGGNLQILPRLYTFIQSLKPEQRQGILLLDLGNSCADDVWHCQITRGRSTLIVLDGMGYHACNVDGLLDADGREKTESVVTMGLVDKSHDWAYAIPPVQDDSIRATIDPIPNNKTRLQIDLNPSDSIQLERGILRLNNVAQAQVGIIKIDLRDVPEIVSTAVYSLPDHTPPNPTIVASVEFVESEARYFQKKQH